MKKSNISMQKKHLGYLFAMVVWPDKMCKKDRFSPEVDGYEAGKWIMPDSSQETGKLGTATLSR